MIWQIFLPGRSSFRKISPKSSYQSRGQTHGWILLKKTLYFISLYSILCSWSPFHREWPQMATILTSFDFPLGTMSNSLIFDMNQAIHGEKDLTCKELNKNWYNRNFFSRGSIHAYGLQMTEAIFSSNHKG